MELLGLEEIEMTLRRSGAVEAVPGTDHYTVDFGGLAEAIGRALQVYQPVDRQLVAKAYTSGSDGCLMEHQHDDVPMPKEELRRLMYWAGIDAVVGLGLVVNTGTLPNGRQD